MLQHYSLTLQLRGHANDTPSLSPSNNHPRSCKGPLLVLGSCLVATDSDKSHTFATDEAGNESGHSLHRRLKQNTQPCSFAFFGLFLGIVISEGITIECNLHTKKRCDQFCVITHEVNADSNATLDFLKLCLCP